MPGTVPGAVHAVIDWIIVQQIFTPLPFPTADGVCFPAH